MRRSLLIFHAMCALVAAEERPSFRCIENSPERRGEEGCSILAERPLVAPMNKPTYWHIDRFDSLEAATKAAGPDGVPAEAHGSVWLMTVEPRTEEHRGGRHVALIGPLAVPAARGYSMRVLSSLLLRGGSSPVHTHSGPEVFYIVAGEQCLETREIGHRLTAGHSYVLPTGVVHRGTGSSVRRAVALVLYDSAQPASHEVVNAPSLVACQ